MRKPSPAMIVALLALFVALGGVGAAATRKSHTTPARFYAARAEVASGHRKFLLALRGIGTLTAWCFASNGETSASAKTRLQSSANRLRVFVENFHGSDEAPVNLNRGQVVFDGGGAGSADWYHSTYSAFGKSGAGFEFGTIDVFGTGGPSGGTCHFQVSAMVQRN